MRHRHWLGCAPVASALLGLSCQAALGIEDLSDQPRPDALGSGGAGGAGNGPRNGPSDGGGTSADPSRAGGAGQGLAGTSGAALDAGSESTGSGDVLPDAAGAPPAHAAPPDDVPPGTSTDAGAPPAAGAIRVSGRVLDFFRRPVPSVPVSIGGTSSLTDEQGRFSIAGVVPPYDVTLSVRSTRDGVPSHYGYVFEGLTRSDPTLQVYSALVQRTSSSFDVTIENGDFEADPDRRVILAFSSPDGRFADESLTSDSTSFVGGIEWTGPTHIQGTVHALRVIGEDSFDGSPPLAYEAHQSSALGVADGALAAVDLDLQANAVPSDVIAGSVGGGPLGERENLVALRFADGTALPLLEQGSSEQDFAYLVPALEDTSLVVAAVDGSAGLPPYALAWRDGVAAGDVDLELEIPNPVTLSAPQSGAGVDADSTFAWSAANQTARTFVWHLESNDPSAYEGMLVITARTALSLPHFPDGFTILPGTSFVWSVETHGEAPDVDALAGPDGFLDPFSVLQNFPVGPGRGGGYYTESARSAATMNGD